MAQVRVRINDEGENVEVAFFNDADRFILSISINRNPGEALVDYFNRIKDRVNPLQTKIANIEAAIAGEGWELL